MTRASLPHLAVIGLGANLGNPLATLRMGLTALQKHPQTTDWRVSPFYRTAPMGATEAQPDYVNAVALCRTDMTPDRLMQWLLDVECQFGRDRSHDTVRNAPRTLDLDLLMVDDISLQSPLLTLPHPRLHERAFVLRPLLDLLPDATISTLGRLDAYWPSVANQAIEQLTD